MDSICKYLLSIVAAALICGILKSVIGKNGSFCAVVNMVCGLFLAITVLSPALNIQFSDSGIFSQQFQMQADAAVDSGTAAAEKELRQIIKENAQAYILDKAAVLDLDITADITVSQTSPPVPCAVMVHGAVSPYAKSVLETFISDQLGIPKEAQRWTSVN